MVLQVLPDVSVALAAVKGHSSLSHIVSDALPRQPSTIRLRAVTCEHYWLHHPGQGQSRDLQPATTASTSRGIVVEGGPLVALRFTLRIRAFSC